MTTMNNGRLAFDGGLRAGLRVFGLRIVVLAASVVGFNLIGWGTLALWPTSAYIYAALAMGLVAWWALRTMTRMESVRRPRRRRRAKSPAPHVIDLRNVEERRRRPTTLPPPRDRRLPQNAALRALHDRMSVVDAEAQRLSTELRRAGATKEQIQATLMAFYASGGRGDEMTVERLVNDFRLGAGKSSAAAVEQLADSYAALLVADDPDRGRPRHGGRPRNHP